MTIPQTTPVTAITECLTRLPEAASLPDDPPWVAHSLTRGAAGITLAHIERARQGAASWRTTHTWITHACAGQVSASPNTGLFQGLPAIAFVLHTTGRYTSGLADTLPPLARLTHRRAANTHARIAAGAPTSFREYDVFFGLTGLGALLMRLAPAGSALEHLLTALVALTRPRTVDDQRLPGWWSDHAPHRRRSAAFPGGHANLGMAHGITGPLALLALTARAGHTVDGHHQAIATILDFLDTWRQDGPNGPWWPQWINRTDHATGYPSQTQPGRPSWCYGTPGIARAAQLAALALGDTTTQQAYENAFAACLNDPAQVGLITEPGLCHGAAGLYQTAYRAARDATTPELATHLPDLANRLTRIARIPHRHGPGFLDGDAGTLLALHTANRPLDLGWDACLLLT